MSQAEAGFHSIEEQEAGGTSGPSKGGRKGREELVPSRYAVRVGDIEVLVVSDGVLPLPTDMLGHNVDQADRAAWLGDMFLPPETLEWALNVVVVKSGLQTILIDAGLGLDPDLNLPSAGQLIRRLEAAGIDLATITDVVLTHLHMDHIGGLLIEGVKQRLRPDLRIHVAAAEIKFWEAPDFSHAVMPDGFPDALQAIAKRFVIEYRDNLSPFDDEAKVAPGVVAQRTGGHTPGHSVVRITDRNDQLVFAGDALFAVAFDHPNWYNGFEHDPEEAARVRRRLLTELAETGSWLVATHLPFPSVGHVAFERDHFRWVPVFWKY